MDTLLKISSVKKDKYCNCISPFYLNNITGINPNTNREYDKQDIDAMKTSLYRISNSKGCNVEVCCDPNDPNLQPDSKFIEQFTRTYPKIMPMYQGSQLISIKLSTTKDIKESGWIDPTPFMICKITKATIQDTNNPTIKNAINLVQDCFSDSCNSAEMITIDNLLQNSKTDMKYTYFDDARVSQAILENNISYVKEYIRKYKNVNQSLTNDDYNNRLIHIAAGSKYNDILVMLIALKANLNIQNKDRDTPIQLAIRANNINNIDTLLSQGIDLTIPNKNGETPMFSAMKTGDLRIIKMLYNNNSPIHGVDKDGNNLIHYCILHCPSFEIDDKTIPNTKGDIINFLIDRGISSEAKNKAGLTPLELVSKKINKEINKECSLRSNKETKNIIEHFFNSNQQITQLNTNNTNTTNNIPNTNTISNTNTNTIANTTNTAINNIYTGGAVEKNTDDFTREHIELLDIQTRIFNNIIRNNPEKYNEYISVGDLPAGAPIEVLDTVCIGGNNIIGNEDSEECVAKGGRISKIKNKTTKIKLELIPEQQSYIDNIKADELYYSKERDKIPVGTIPNNISSYNASLMNQNTTNTLLYNVPMTTGITYSIGTTPNNTTGITVSQEVEFNPQPTQPIPTTQSNNVTGNVNMKVDKSKDHPAMIPEDNEVVQKCKTDAIQNSTKIANTTKIQIQPNKINPNETNPLLISIKESFTNANSSNKNTSQTTYWEMYKIPIVILLIILLIVIYVMITN